MDTSALEAFGEKLKGRTDRLDQRSRLTIEDVELAGLFRESPALSLIVRIESGGHRARKWQVVLHLDSRDLELLDHPNGRDAYCVVISANLAEWWYTRVNRVVVEAHELAR